MNMKKHRSVIIAACTLSLGLAAFSGCNKRDREELASDAKEAYRDTKASIAEGVHDLREFTFEKREAFAARLKAHQARFDAQISELRAEYSEAKAGASRRAAMNELKNAESDYKAKLAALGQATTATWNAARDDVVAAWDRMQAAYLKARAD